MFRKLNSSLLLLAVTCTLSLTANAESNSQISVKGGCIISTKNGSANYNIELNSLTNNAILLDDFNIDEAKYQLSILKFATQNENVIGYQITLARIQDDYMANQQKVKANGRTSTQATIYKNISTNSLEGQSYNYFEITKNMKAHWNGKLKVAEGTDFTMSLFYAVKAGRQNQEVTVICPISVK